MTVGRPSSVKAPSLYPYWYEEYDAQMEAYAEDYPGYGFEVHKGYGTKAHYAALTEKGPSPIHRMTFLKKFYGEK